MFQVQRFLDPKKFRVPISGSKKVLVPEKLWVPKNFGFRKILNLIKIGSKKDLRPEKI